MGDVRVEDKDTLTAAQMAVNDLFVIVTAAGLVKNAEFSEVIKKVLGGGITAGIALPSAAVVLDSDKIISGIGGIKLITSYEPAEESHVVTKKYVDNTILNDDYAVLMKKLELTYADLASGVAEKVLTAEAGTLILGIYIYISTGFTDSGTDLMKVGITSDDDYFETDFDVSSTGWKVIDAITYPYRSAAEDITITYTAENGNVDAGTVEIYVKYAKF